MNVALVYDRINKWGGAERVLLALHELYPEAPLYTAVYDSKKAQWARVFTIHTSFMQKFPFAKTRHEWYPWLTPLAFESFTFDEYDVVISITSADAKGIITKPGTVHICYCLTPTRYLWSHYDTYFRSNSIKTLAKPITSYLRKWDRIAAQRPDHIISISDHINNRVKTYYDQNSDVVYPPVNTASTVEAPSEQIADKDGGYFLVVSRLVRYKCVDIAIQACNKLNVPLIIIGKGSDYSRLKSMAGSSVTFLKDLTDKELAWYYQHSRVLIMSQQEDFGIVAVEAQMYGTPVITYKNSGAFETIIEHKTGLALKDQKVTTLVEALDSFDKTSYNKQYCIQNAQRFGKDTFKRKMKQKVEQIYSKHKT